MKTPAVKTIYALVVLSGVLYAFIVLRGPNGISGLHAKQKLIHEYEESNQKMQREIEEKQMRIERLKGDSEEQERVIRERLKLTRPGEKVYIYESRQP